MDRASIDRPTCPVTPKGGAPPGGAPLFDVRTRLEASALRRRARGRPPSSAPRLPSAAFGRGARVRPSTLGRHRSRSRRTADRHHLVGSATSPVIAAPPRVPSASPDRHSRSAPRRPRTRRRATSPGRSTTGGAHDPTGSDEPLNSPAGRRGSCRADARCRRAWCRSRRSRPRCSSPGRSTGHVPSV